MSQHDLAGDGIIYKKAGFDENSITECIKSYLNPDLSFNFGWGSLSQDLIKHPIPFPKYDSRVVGVYNGPKGQSEVVQLVIKFIKDNSGQTVSSDQIMLTNGATNAIFLLAHYFTNVKQVNKVMLQSPVFDTALNIIKSQKLKRVGIDPCCIDIPDIEKAFSYLIFKFQNPTGISVNNKNKLKIIDQITSKGNYVIEDDSYGLLEKGGKINLVANPLYIFISSFSKYIFPGLRIGYIIADPKIINDLQVIQKYYNSHPNVISQYILAEYLKNGLIESEIKHKIKQLNLRRQLFETNISDKIKKHIDHTTGGFYYWLRLSESCLSIEVFVDLLRQGIITIPGDIYFSKNPYPALRLCVSLIDKENIGEGCRLINRVLGKYV